MDDNLEDEQRKDKRVSKRKIAGMNILSVLYSAAKKVSTVAVIYLVGYMQWSMGWFMGPIVLLVIRDQYRKAKERRCKIAQASALAKEEDVVLARLDDLPAWVFFPDVERAEWLNRILKQLWPNVNHYVRDMIRDKIQPKMEKKFKKYKLNGFRFEKIILGSIPPRIGGVKVYDANVSRNEIVLDLDVFYAGDCDLSFALSGFKGGIKDLQLEGMCRVILKPLLTSMPLVGGLQVFFLNNPSIDFNLVGVMDILDMPGFSDLLRQLITEQVASMMVLPNKLPIKLSKHIEAEALNLPIPQGVLRIHVVEAKNLMKKDIGILGKGKSDPYCILSVGAQEYRTPVIDNTVDPKWDYWCEFVIMDANGQQLFLHLLDYDDGSKDDDLGRATVDIATVAKKGEDDMWITLEQAKHGLVHLRLTWLTLSTDYSDLKAAIEETQLLQVTAMSTALLTLYIDSAKNLPQARTQSKPDPYVLITIGRGSQQTLIKKRASDPVWEQGYNFLVPNPESDTLYLNIIDQKTGQGLGQLTYNVSALSDKPNLCVPLQPFGLLKSGPQSKLSFSMHLKILKRGLPEEQSDAPEGSDVEFNRQDSVSSVGSLDRANSAKKLLLSRESSLKIMDGTNNIPEVEEAIEAASVNLQSSTPPDSPTDGIIHRQVNVTSSAGDAGLGRIQLTLRYSVQRQRLIVVIHKVANIPQSRDPNNIPDPYVKLYLLPGRSKETKRKTPVVKDSYNPVFDITFEYLMSQGEMNTQKLEVTVATQKQLLSTGSNILGQVIIDLGKFNLTQSNTFWFDLLPEVDN